MSSSASSNSTEIITNVVFGITATTISVVTVWQGHKVWKMWREYAHGQGDAAPDIELGVHAPQSMPTNLEAPEREGVVASSAPSITQVGEVADPARTAVSAQGLELGHTLPTTVDAETSSGPALVQGAQIDSNELPRIHTDDTQPASTDVDPRELPPAANDHLWFSAGVTKEDKERILPRVQASILSIKSGSRRAIG